MTEESECRLMFEQMVLDVLVESNESLKCDGLTEKTLLFYRPEQRGCWHIITCQGWISGEHYNQLVSQKPGVWLHVEFLRSALSDDLSQFSLDFNLKGFGLKWQTHNVDGKDKMWNESSCFSGSWMLTLCTVGVVSEETQSVSFI